MRVILLFGGESEERRVSVATGQNILQNLPSAEPWFIDPKGKVFICQPKTLLEFSRPFEADFDPQCAVKFASLSDALKDGGYKESVFLLGLHGRSSEDGSLQAEFEKAGVAYTGSNSEASHRAFDKTLTKAIVSQAGGKVAGGLEFARQDLLGNAKKLRTFWQKEKDIICKPVLSGSSFCLFRIRTEAEFNSAVSQMAASAHNRYLAETFIIGRELTVGVWQTAQGPRALPPSEVRTQVGKNFDYSGKYLGLGSLEITPAEITPNETRAAQALALLAHENLGCEGCSRTDMILSDQGLYFIETNTLPGLTRASFIPQQLAQAQISFKEFLERLVQEAANRREMALK